MIDAFVYLTWRSSVNRWRVRLRRLREPRYAIGLVFGALYLYTWLLRPSRRAGAQTLAGLLIHHQLLIEALGSVALLVVAAVAWALPSSRPALPFTRGEVQFLFPAPVTRKALLRYKVARGQLASVFSSAFFTLIFRPGTVAAGWTFFAGVLCLTMTLNLYLTGLSLRRESLRQHGRRGLTPQLLPIALFAVALGLVGVAVARDWPILIALDDAARIAGELQRLLLSGAVSIVLLPFRALAALPVSGTAAEFVRRLPAVVVVIAVTYFWIERSDVALGETSADAAEKLVSDGRGRPVSTPKVRSVRAPFELGSTGAPEVAIVWKNLILLGRYFSVRTFVRLLPLVVVLIAVASGRHGEGAAHVIGSVALIATAGAVLFGPQMLRNDLRQDLLHLPVIRTWPMRGASIVRGEVLAPAAVLTAIAWLLLGVGVFLSGPTPFDSPMALVDRLAYAASAMLLAPGLILLQLLVHNGIAIAFPSWVQIGASRSRGLDVTGQRLLMLAGMLLALVVTLLPAVIAGGVVGLGIYATTHRVPVLIPAAVAAGVLLVEVWVGTELLGGLLNRTDVGAIDASE